MKAAVLFAKGDLRYTDWPEPSPGPDELKIRVRACGICGSDIPRIWGEEAHFYPIVLGHEFSGEVVELGSAVEGFALGDRVAGAPLLPCMRCADCQRGDYALCRHYSFIGSRKPGAFAEYVVIPAANAVKFADTVSFAMGALFEPTTVALHGLLCAPFSGGDDVAIMGTGNIGILALQWAKILGAKRVAVFDIFEERLALARRLGADLTFNTQDGGFADAVAEATNGAGFPYVFETAGQPDTIKLGFTLCAPKGRFTCIGTPHREVSFDYKLWELMNRKEFRLTGSWMSYSAPFPGREWALSAHYFSTGELRLDDSMIFARYPLSACAEAAALFAVPGQVKGKVLLTNDEF